MTRNLKALGLAMGAMLVMGALGASTASAVTTVGQLTSDGPVTLTGTEQGEPGSGANALTNPDGSKAECAGSTYTGHAVGSTDYVEPGATEVTITPHYNQENCHTFNAASETFDLTVFTNGCDYVIKTGEKVSEHVYKASFDIACPAGAAIEVVSYAGPFHGFPVCTDKVGPQTGLEGAHLRHTTTGEGDDIDITGTVEGIHAERSGACVANPVTTNESKFDIDVTVTGHNADGNDTEVTVTDETIEA